MTPFEKLLKNIDWKAVEKSTDEKKDGLPYVTHEATLTIFNKKLKCYQLSDGNQIIDKDDMESFFRIGDQSK
jgi:Flp pilus assembly protein CpaB